LIGPKVKLGDYNFIGPFCLIQGETQIGDNNRFEAYVSVGAPPESREHFLIDGAGVIIGSKNIFREFVTINSGTSRATRIGDGVIMLRNSHAGHDVIVHNDVTISCSVLLGGHSEIGEGSNLGLGSMVHQRCLIGAHAMLGMGAIANKTTAILPGNIYVGNPARFLKENKIALDKAQLNGEKIAKLRAIYVARFQFRDEERKK
jgi:UDP-N-acetylglucosamine acyltransferase